MITKTPKYWQEYKLLDFGNGVKIEQFNSIITIRPETNATKNLSKGIAKWKKEADFIYNSTTVNGGKWNVENISEWYINYKSKRITSKFLLQLSNSKHIGIFPEQSVNWEFVANKIKKNNTVLNLFAYTGAISVISAQLGAKVTHVDSSKTAIKHAKKNANINNVNNIRFILDDASFFVKKEEKRGNKYDFVILDPPTYGFGAKGKKWKINKDLELLLQSCKNILNPKATIILNTYSPKFSFKNIIPIIKNIFGKNIEVDYGSLLLNSIQNNELVLSDYYIVQI